MPNKWRGQCDKVLHKREGQVHEHHAQGPRQQLNTALQGIPTFHVFTHLKCTRLIFFFGPDTRGNQCPRWIAVKSSSRVSVPCRVRYLYFHLVSDYHFTPICHPSLVRLYTGVLRLPNARADFRVPCSSSLVFLPSLVSQCYEVINEDKRVKFKF